MEGLLPCVVDRAPLGRYNTLKWWDLLSIPLSVLLGFLSYLLDFFYHCCLSIILYVFQIHQNTYFTFLVLNLVHKGVCMSKITTPEPTQCSSSWNRMGNIRFWLSQLNWYSSLRTHCVDSILNCGAHIYIMRRFHWIKPWNQMVFNYQTVFKSQRKGIKFLWLCVEVPGIKDDHMCGYIKWKRGVLLDIQGMWIVCEHHLLVWEGELKWRSWQW